MFKKALSFFVAAIMLAVACIPAFAAKTYTVEEIGISVDIPDGYYVITRDISPSDSVFSVLGLDYDALMEIMKNGNIYLDAVGENSEEIMLITYPVPGIEDLSDFTTEELTEFEEGFISGYETSGIEVLDYQIYETDEHVYFKVEAYEESNDVYIMQYANVLDEQMYMLGLRSLTEITDAQISMMESCVDTISYDFLEENTEEYTKAESEDFIGSSDEEYSEDENYDDEYDSNDEYDDEYDEKEDYDEDEDEDEDEDDYIETIDPSDEDSSGIPDFVWIIVIAVLVAIIAAIIIVVVKGKKKNEPQAIQMPPIQQNIPVQQPYYPPVQQPYAPPFAPAPVPVPEPQKLEPVHEAEKAAEAEVPAPTVTTQAPETEEKPKPAFCSNCGAALRPDAKFCPMCGSTIG